MDEKSKGILIRNMTENLPALRRILHLSQDELAGMVGVSRSTIAIVECGRHPMSWNLFMSLLLVFTKNKETNRLLNAMEIYTDEFNEFIKCAVENKE